jgi:hypothetical protein
MSPHGTSSRYGQGCKCKECRAAHATYMREYRRWKRSGRTHSCPTCTCGGEQHG